MLNKLTEWLEETDREMYTQRNGKKFLPLSHTTSHSKTITSDTADTSLQANIAAFLHTGILKLRNEANPFTSPA